MERTPKKRKQVRKGRRSQTGKRVAKTTVMKATRTGGKRSAEAKFNLGFYRGKREIRTTRQAQLVMALMLIAVQSIFFVAIVTSVCSVEPTDSYQIDQPQPYHISKETGGNTTKAEENQANSNALKVAYAQNSKKQSEVDISNASEENGQIQAKLKALLLPPSREQGIEQQELLSTNSQEQEEQPQNTSVTNAQEQGKEEQQKILSTNSQNNWEEEAKILATNSKEQGSLQEPLVTESQEQGIEEFQEPLADELQEQGINSLQETLVVEFQEQEIGSLQEPLTSEFQEQEENGLQEPLISLAQEIPISEDSNAEGTIGEQGVALLDLGEGKIVVPVPSQTEEQEEETTWIDTYEPYTENLVIYLGNVIHREVGGYISTLPHEDAIKAFELTGSVVLHRLEVGYSPDVKTIYEVIHAKGQYGGGTKNTINDYERVGTDECYEVSERLLRDGPIGPRNLVFQAGIKQGTLYWSVDDNFYGPTYFGTSSQFADYGEEE